MGGMKGMGASMGIGMAGGALMMGAGAVGESNAGLGAAMSAGGMALSMGSMLPMLGPMLAPLAGIALPALAVAAALATVGAGLYIWRKNVDDAAVKAAEFGSNIGGTANALNTMAQVLGTLTPAQSRQKAVMGISSEEEATIANEFSGVFESGAGQKFIEDLQNSTSAERFQKLSDYLKSAIASGMMDQQAATTFAKAVGLKLGDSVLSNQAVSSISGQKTGTSAMKEIADMRKAAVDADGSLLKLAESSGKASISNETAGRAIGAASQILQDYGNVIGVAEQQYAEGIIGWNEYHTAITEARVAQEQYTNVLKKSLTNSADKGGSAQALSQQLTAMGYTEDQQGALEQSTAIGTLKSAFTRTIDGKNTNVRDAYGAEFVTRQAEDQFGKSFGELSKDQRGQLQVQAFETEDLANTALENGLNAELAAAVIAGEMNLEQAVQFGDAVMYSTDALKAFNDGASIAAVNFMMFTKNIPGLTKGQSDALATTGKQYEAAGGNPALLENYTASLPENLRGIGTNTLVSAGVQVGARGMLLSPEEQMRRQTDLAFGFQSLSGSIGAEQAVGLQKSSAYGKALGQVDGSEKINKAFAAAAEGGVAEKVIKYVIQTEGANNPDDLVNKITQLTTATKEIMSLPDDMIKGLGIDVTPPSDLEKYGPMVENFKNSWKIIEDLNPNLDKVANMKFIMTGAGGKDATADEIANNIKTLNDAWSSLSSKNKNTRLQAIRQLIISTQDENGNQLDQTQVDAAYNDLIDKFGGKIMNLPPDVLNKLVSLQVEIEGIDEAIAAKKAQLAIIGISGGAALQKEIEALEQAKAIGIAAQKSTVSNATKTTGGGGGGGEKSIPQQLKEQVKTSQSMFSNISKLQSSKGFKKFIAGPFAPEFLEYLRSQGAAGLKIIKGSLEKVKAAYANFEKSKISEGAAMAALTPQALVQESKKTALSSQYNKKLAEKGLYEDDINAIRELVSDEDLLAKKILERKLKNKTITDSERKQLGKYRREQAAAEKYVPIINQAQKISGSIVDMKTETTLLNEQIALINEGQTPELAAAMAAAGLRAGDATGNVELFTDAYNKLIAAQYAADPGKLEQDKRDNLMEINNLNRQIEEINLIRPLEDQVKVQQKIIDGQEKLVRVKQQEIDVIGRTIELKQRELEPLDDQIEKLQELSDKTSEAYDAQIEALDEIYNREENIAKLKQGQLDVAQALSRGDVAAAAQGALGMSQELARQSREEARSALELQKEKATQNIQNKILEIEKQKKKINQDIEDLQMRQRAIQDDIYTIQSTKILPAENEIYRLQGLINVEADMLDDKYNNATIEMKNLVAQLDLAIKRQEYLNSITPGAKVGGATTTTPAGYVPGYGPGTERGGATQSGVDMVRADNPGIQASDQEIAAYIIADPSSGLAAFLESIRKQTAAAPAAAAQSAPAPAPAPPPVVLPPASSYEQGSAMNATQSAAVAASSSPAVLSNAAKLNQAAAAGKDLTKLGFSKAEWAELAKLKAANEAAGYMYGGMINKYAIGGRVGYKGSTERAPGMMYGGSAKKYAYGSTVPGRGMTDKVPALLTPGEFVVRKRVAEQYGPLLELLNGQVFPTMKTNSFNSSSQAQKSGSMYNYNVSVTLNGSDMDANDVANAVIQKIKMTENKGIRSNNIRG
jgi:hypothetical protein